MKRKGMSEEKYLLEELEKKGNRGYEGEKNKQEERGKGM